MDKKQAFLLRYVALAFAVLAPLRRFIGASDTPNLSCSEFRQTLAAGQVGDVVVKEDVAVGLLKADGLEAILPAAVVQSLNKQNDEPRFLTILLNAPDPMAQQGAPFLSPSGPEFVEMPACVSAVRVRDLLEQAARQAPCIVFIDELDAPGNRRMTIGKPDLKGRRQIIEVHARNVTLAPKPAPGSMAARTPGFAGADRASLVNEATLRAARYGKDALDRIITGPEKTNRVKIPMERRFVVFREAGHALVAELREATA